MRSKRSDQPSERVRETLWIIVEVGAVGGQRWREAVVVLVVLLLEPPQRLLREERDIVDAGCAT
jgi:hypothetical protein